MKKLSTTFMLIAATAATACTNAPSSSYGKRSSLSGLASDNTGTISPTLPDLPTDPTPSPTPSPTGNPTYIFRVDAVGYTSVSVKVATRKILKLKFTPGSQDKSVAGTNFSPYYSKMGVYIAVGTQEQPTALTDIETDSFIIDFSNQKLTTCSDRDLGCRQDVTITVKKPNYDYWCFNYGLYCPHTHVYDTHPWNGTLEVQTDDTNAVTRN